MILCLDIGNTNILGGVFKGSKLQVRFRHSTNPGHTADQLGIFLKNVLRENQIDLENIKDISMSSVVPHLDYALRAACEKYFQKEPFILQAGTKTGIKVKTSNPTEVGADLIASAIAAVHDYPRQNIVIVDLGTVTTFSIISAQREYLGAVFLPGLEVSMAALHEHTAKLFSVEITQPKSIIGRTTHESIQSGIYYGHLGAIHEIIRRIHEEAFRGESHVTISTGGFSHLFIPKHHHEKIHADVRPDLVLEGLYLALLMNRNR